MNNELRDPLEKVSNSLRRAVSINKSRETDLRTTMNTIQRERRRSFNTWSLKQEKFLRAKQNLVPAILFDEASQTKSSKTDDSKQNKPRERRITLVRAVAPVSLADATNRSRSPDIKLPSITAHKSDAGRRKKKSTSEGLPPVITLANSSQFFQESKRTRRISNHRQPSTRYTSETHDDSTQEGAWKGRKVSNIAAFASDKKEHIPPPALNPSYGQPNRAAADISEQEITQQPLMPGITEKRMNTSSPDSDRSLSPNNEHFLPAINTTDNSETGNQKAKGQWKKVRESLRKITGKKQKTDINKLSMMELTKLFEEIRECRYLRVGNRFTAADHSSSSTCKCLACTVKDKNKLKNHLSAPE